ncbi:hypothetical protein HMPREF1990_01182 [Porphyromonas gingivalis W4087]|uniref:hypothetical protein n=1 Tax=Porphyromonas gingivalis TaxID=837 RepID=UPI0003AD384B|nr:hypothetical protein [Porphyromonas gingivalis]ERJ81855.1 hypothetical protein HMPREF1989_02300 [Porphyromonas gingivalis F0566]ERJ88752.1 hypothetical protein HMPREF1990_01182 [Porphyromonas gingivalis W4087]PDP63346.1 hypothetical protein CLI83_00380 [Porphyromonas gingivalis]PDP76059.1 hypothetical protein CLI79_00365 [Porphyromonas gingivalis]
MINPDLEVRLHNWFTGIVSRYQWLSVKFEYSERFGVYLVSYFYESKFDQNIEEYDCFFEESMKFEDQINMDYGDEAPLFCDEEKYFKLSHNAKLIKHKSCNFCRIELIEIEVVELSKFCQTTQTHEVKKILSNYALAA